MRIGEVASLTGVSRKTLRFYEERGLIPTPDRQGSYRTYNDHHVVIINLIKRAQKAGFKLSELQELINLKLSSGEFPTQFALEGIELKRREIQDEIKRLQEIDQDLINLAQEVSAL